MKLVHPNFSLMAIGAIAALLACANGCRSTSGGNAFMGPDRVPPPNTRALLPGQAQPYYRGDPMPAMQSATAPANNAAVVGLIEGDARSSTGRTLTWGAVGNN